MFCDKYHAFGTSNNLKYFIYTPTDKNIIGIPRSVVSTCPLLQKKALFISSIISYVEYKYSTNKRMISPTKLRMIVWLIR